MRVSKSLLPTLKEAPAEAEIPSHILMVRGGYLRKVAAGIYSFLPLGVRVVQKISKIIREEMTRAEAAEVFMPAVIPAELWKESGRWDLYGAQLLRLKDRKQGEFVLGPTHEEVIVDMVRGDVKSYRQLPINLFQIQTKFRDELRPRAGLMRAREFIMKDAYSFHADAEDANREYDNMFATYHRIFSRCGLAFRAVEADTGAIGGTRSHEFQVLAETGEDAIVACDVCDYAANVEQAELRAPAAADTSGVAPHEKISTPGKSSIADVSALLGVKPKEMVKTLLFLADDAPVAVLVRGDRLLNEVKVKAALGVNTLLLANDRTIHEVTGAPTGFAGPIGLKIPIHCDSEVAAMTGFAAGANEGDHHLLNVVLGRDFQATSIGDYRQAQPADACPRCESGHFKAFRGVEVGHVFYLGTKYSEALKCNFLGADGKEAPMIMGCYGIGVTRIAAAAIEQHHDQDGICWPLPIAPFEVHLLNLQSKDDAVNAACETLYETLTAAGIEVLYDDRDERPGSKFKDADLIGLPYRIAIGKKGLAEGIAEVKARRQSEVTKVALDAVVDQMVKTIVAERKGDLS